MSDKTNRRTENEWTNGHRIRRQGRFSSEDRQNDSSMRRSVCLTVCPSVRPSIWNSGKPPKEVIHARKTIVVMHWSISDASHCVIARPGMLSVYMSHVYTMSDARIDRRTDRKINMDSSCQSTLLKGVFGRKKNLRMGNGGWNMIYLDIGLGGSYVRRPAEGFPAGSKSNWFTSNNFFDEATSKTAYVQCVQMLRIAVGTIIHWGSEQPWIET